MHAAMAHTWMDVPASCLSALPACLHACKQAMQAGHAERQFRQAPQAGRQADCMDAPVRGGSTWLLGGRLNAVADIGAAHCVCGAEQAGVRQMGNREWGHGSHVCQCMLG